MAIAHQPGEIIRDKYRIIDILGKGGVAITYSAVNLQTDSSVAIKVISLKQLHEWKQVELFKREAEVLAKLNHPAIPKYLDYFDRETETDKAFYIVQEQASGKSLAELVESGWRTTEAEVKNIAQQILEILTYLHSLEPPVIHRDIKPNNLIRSDEGKIYLVDFGAVQNTYYNTLMRGSTVVGTYGYMAPEQFRGKAVPATDLYSLGATLLYLLTHRSPAELPQDTLKLDFRNSVDISESFADWLEKILEPDLEDRFANAEVAISKLFSSKRKRNRKIITSLGIGVLAIGLIAGINSYKWLFLSNFGFYPDNICSEPNSIISYMSKAGKINITFSNAFKKEISLIGCIIKSDLIKKNDQINLINKLIKKGYDPNYKGDSNNDPPLIMATNYRFIADKKRNRYSTNQYELSTSSQTYYGDLDLVTFLLENGAEVDIKDKYGNTPLFSAVRNKDTKIAELLIKYGANINAINNNHETPLFNALHEEDINMDLIKFLLKKGANVNVTTKHGSNPLLIAVNKEDINLITLLIDRGANVNAKNKTGNTILSKAVFKGNIEIVKLLLENGANAKNQNIQGNNVLFNAVSQENIEVVKLLIEHGANAKIKNKYNESLLANVKKKEIAELLIEHGADVNAQRISKHEGQIKYGNTPLFNAIYNKNVDVVKLLLKNGADVNIKDEKYNTPLFVAVFQNNLEIARLLLKYKSNVIRLNGDGKSILFYAENENIAKLLIDNGADVNAKDARDGNTPLFEIRNFKVLRLLINNGADVNAKNKYGKTPLFYSKNIDKMQLLINNGANINTLDKYGNTSLFNYIDNHYTYKHRIQLLIDSGADINAKNKYGQTPVSKAIFNESKETVQLLIDSGADTSYLDPDKGYFNPDKIRELHNMNYEKYLRIKNFLQKNKFDLNRK